MHFLKKSDRKMNKRGFTMIELIGAMVIIAILTVAGITAIATAINNSRMSATQTDLSGFRTPIENFMLENPQMAKETDVNKIAVALNEYLEGEMQFIDATQATAETDNQTTYDYGTPNAGGWQVKRMDAWDQNFRVYIDTDNHSATQGSNDAKDTELRIYVISNGTNSTTGVDNTKSSNRYVDGDDDLFLCVQMVNGQVSSGYYGFDDGDSLFATDDADTDSCKVEITDTNSGVGLYKANGTLAGGSIQDLSNVVFANTVTKPAP